MLRGLIRRKWIWGGIAILSIACVFLLVLTTNNDLSSHHNRSALLLLCNDNIEMINAIRVDIIVIHTILIVLLYY